ncbi:MAG: amidohydrolase family protein [candidate division NC10 bacterium]|nr:amidohydrolase family protein [candidate division NC10 bacterium]
MQALRRNPTIGRRDLLKLGSCGLIAVAVGESLCGGKWALAGGPAKTSGNQQGGMALVIKNGKAFIEGRWQTLDIGITDQGRLHISQLPLFGRSMIDASHKIVSAGFIDILGDNSSSPERTYRIFEKYKVTDGVTTVLQMHGGADEIRKYYTEFGKRPHWTNYGVSTKVMRIRQLYQTLRERCRRIERCLDEGALGVSHSIEYQPDTSWEELVEYARLARKYERPLFLHLRYSSAEKELEGVEEAIELARVTGVRIHIDHLHSTGGTYHMAEALQRIRNAIQAGLEITTCVYPYDYWATYLHSERFAPGWQDRFHLTYSDLEIVGTGERLTAESFEKYRKQPGILVAVPRGTMPLETTVDLALQEDFCLVSSDGGIQSEPRANSHPRGAGCFATAIRRAIDIQMSLEKMLEKVTLLPRRVLRPALDQRGILEEGAVADLTLFDPDQINGAATNENPNQFSRGIHTVIVNGSVAYHQGKLQMEKGQPIAMKPYDRKREFLFEERRRKP